MALEHGVLALEYTFAPAFRGRIVGRPKQTPSHAHNGLTQTGGGAASSSESPLEQPGQVSASSRVAGLPSRTTVLALESPLEDSGLSASSIASTAYLLALAIAGCARAARGGVRFGNRK